MGTKVKMLLLAVAFAIGLSLPFAVLPSADAQTPTPIPGTYSGTLHNANTTNSSGTTLTLNGQVPVMTIQASGTFNGATYEIQGSLDNTNFNNLTCATMDGGTSNNAAGWLTAAGMWQCDTTGVVYLKATNNSGTPTTVTMLASPSTKAFSPYRPGTPGTLTSPTVVTGVNDSNGLQVLGVTASTTAVNNLTITNAPTLVNPILGVTGTDSNIGIQLKTKGTGAIQIFTPATDGTHIEVHQGTATTLSNCGGGSVTAGSTDFFGKFTAGKSSGGNCTLVFTKAWTNAPLFVMTVNGTSRASAPVVQSANTVAFNLKAGSYATSDVITYLVFSKF